MADSDTLLIALLAAGAFSGLMFALLYPLFSSDKQKDKRIASVTDVRIKKTSARSAADIAAQRKKQVTDTLKDLETRQKAKEKVTLRLRMERAGLDAEPRSYWIASALSGLGCVVLVFLSTSGGGMANVALVVAALIGTFGLPRWFLSKMVARRQYKFQRELANSIDVIVRGVKSGLPLNECLQIIARESPEPVSTEFRYVVEQQRIGVPLHEALERLINRMPLSEVKFLSIVIAIQQQAGGNLSEALSNLSGVLRDRFRMEMKVKALSAEAKSSAWVLSSLPPSVTVMVHLSAPDYIHPLFSTTAGNLVLAAGGFWMLCGVLVMRKMINFKF